jgi:hypothetical protein
MFMSDLIPSLQEWRDLYQAATEFKKIGCWNWMSDTELFGVQNPVNGMTGYCCIMGELKEMLGLVVYLGTEGLAGYLKIQSEDFSSDAIDFLHDQKCLTATFESRKYLREPDLEVIRKLGLKFRGHHEWPLFRNYQPGYLPWYLNRDEVIHLTTTIPQVIEVALRVKENKDLLVPPNRNHHLVRVPEKVGEAITWRDEWREPSPVETVEYNVSPVDELHLQRIKENHFTTPEQIDRSLSRVVMKEKAYFPYVFLWVDHDASFSSECPVAELSDYQTDFKNQFMDLASSSFCRRIWCQNENL